MPKYGNFSTFWNVFQILGFMSKYVKRLNSFIPPPPRQKNNGMKILNLPAKSVLNLAILFFAQTNHHVHMVVSDLAS